jgi:glycosyltransferase involved in cell wall biosynthesis
MRILQINTEKSWRGGERQTLLTMQTLAEKGHQLDLLTARESELASRAKAAGFNVFEADSGIGFGLKLLSLARGYDVVHAQTAKAVTWAALVRLLVSTPLVFTKRTSFALKRGHWKTRLKWLQVDRLIAISEAAAAGPRELGIETQVIPSAVAVIDPHPERIQAFLVHRSLQGRRLVGTAAALSFEKDPLTLIEAAAEVCKAQDDVTFVHWGAAEQAAHAARERIDQLGLQDRYLLLGFEQSVEQLYPALSVFVMASKFEALGSSVLDAMQQRVPVVSTDAGGLKETLANGRGLLVAVGDVHAMASQILLVLGRPSVIVPMVQQAFEDVQAHYSVSAMADRYLEVYRGLTTA